MGLVCWVSVAPVLGFRCCWVLIFALSPFGILIYMFSGIMRAWVGGISCRPGLCVSEYTSELRMGLAQWNRFKPSSEIFLLTVPGWCFFCGSFVLFMPCVCHASTSVHCCLVVAFWEGGGGLLALVCGV